MAFQENLIKLRKKAGYSARSFSKVLNIPYTTYLAYEKTDREPKYDLLIKIANILNVSVDELIGKISNNKDERLKQDIDILLSPFENEICEYTLKVVSISDTTVKFFFDNVLSSYYFCMDKDTLIKNIAILKKKTQIMQKSIFQDYIDIETQKILNEMELAFARDCHNIDISVYFPGETTYFLGECVTDIVSYALRGKNFGKITIENYKKKAIL